MGSTNQVDVISVIKLGNDILTKGEGDSAVILAPVGDLLVRVRPKKITEEPGIRDICRPHNILNRVNFG